MINTLAVVALVAIIVLSVLALKLLLKRGELNR